jgi:transcriptional regulator with XRE-family HTH domain
MGFLALMDLRQIIATNLRKARHAKGLSQEALAHDAGVDRRYMSRVETADTWVGTQILAKLAAVLEIEPCELLRPPRRR